MLELFCRGKKIKGGINKRMNVIDTLSEASGISQRWLRNIHTEFVANDGRFLLPLNCYTASRVRTRNRCPQEIFRFANAFRGTVSHESPNQPSNHWT